MRPLLQQAQKAQQCDGSAQRIWQNIWFGTPRAPCKQRRMLKLRRRTKLLSAPTTRVFQYQACQNHQYTRRDLGRNQKARNAAAEVGVTAPPASGRFALNRKTEKNTAAVESRETQKEVIQQKTVGLLLK